MISQKQRTRQAKLIKRYQGLGVRSVEAEVLARCVIERRGGFGLFRACGVPVHGQREGTAQRIKRHMDRVWAMRKDISVEVSPPAISHKAEV